MATITYAIGDVHGRLDLLDGLLGQVEADATARGADATVVLTGDYVDRGSDSCCAADFARRAPPVYQGPSHVRRVRI